MDISTLVSIIYQIILTKLRKTSYYVHGDSGIAAFWRQLFKHDVVTQYNVVYHNHGKLERLASTTVHIIVYYGILVASEKPRYFPLVITLITNYNLYVQAN